SAPIGSRSPSEHDRRCAVAEQTGGNDVGHGKIVGLKRKRTELDRNEKRDLMRKARKVVGCPRRSRGARHAAQPKNGRSLHVLTKAEAVDEASVDAGSRDAGDRHEEDVIDVARREAYRVERVSRGALPQIEGDVDPRVVAFAERSRETVARG